MSEVAEITIKGLSDLAVGTYLLVDVRDAISFGYGAIPGAVSMPDIVEQAEAGKLAKDKKYIKYAFSRTLPVLFGYIFLGIAFGIVLQQAGFNFIWAFCISLFLYAVSIQFVLVPLLASAASPLTVAVTTLFVNSRHVFYGLSFIESFKKMKTQLYMIFSLSDETYSVLCSCKNEDPEEKNRPAWFLINLFDQSYWIIGSVIGALLGQVLPFDFTGIDFSMTALFVVILLDQVLAHPKAAGRCAVTGLLAGIICLFIFGSGNFLLPALIITVLFVTAFAQAERRKELP